METSSFGRKLTWRVLVSIASAAISALALGGVALAETNVFTPFNSPVTNECTGETILIKGVVHTWSDFSTDGIKLHGNFQGLSGEVIVAGPQGRLGVKYVMNSANNYEFDFVDLSEKQTVHVWLIRQAEDGTFVAGDDLYFRMHIKPDGTVDGTEFPVCR